MVTMTESPPRRGRPRSAAADDAILAATLELVGEVGISGMAMDELARRAGVAKATIYRRWSNKESLVIDALRSAMSPLESADTGNLRGDLELYLGELISRFDQNPMNDVLPHLIEAACHDPGVQSSLDDYVQVRRAPLRAVFERARERGELDAGADIDVLIDLTIGPFIYRRLLTRDTVDQRFVTRLLDQIFPSA